MSLALRVQQHRNFANIVTVIRIQFVRRVFNVLCYLERILALSQQAEWMADVHKQLEESVPARADAAVDAQRSAFAFITAGPKQNQRYLLQWNANWNMFNLIGGKLDNDKGDGNSFQRAIRREVEEELGLTSPREFVVGPELGQIQVRQFSRREQIFKNYHFAVFEVHILPLLSLSGERPHYFAQWLSTGRENVYVTGAEIENLRTVSGRPISATTRHILRELGALPTVPFGD
ncbi:MAG: NUDIX domain-containing protein [Chloroflexi bacterium]|nr:NUDIX domain-containing protein [Chloroflexota bacterium]